MSDGIVQHEIDTDEHGFSLVLVLVITIFLAVACAALLSQQSTGFKAQSVWRSRGVDATNADSALNAAIESLRYAPNAGVIGASVGDCSQTEPAEASLRTTRQVVSLPTHLQNMSVWCTPQSSVGHGSLVAPLPNTVMTVGGVNRLANLYNVNTGDNDRVPFCQDWATAGNTTCEAGVYVGPGVTDENGGMVIDRPRDRTDHSVLVRSNSSIIVRDGHVLTVKGPTEARDYCTPYNSTKGTGVFLQQVFIPDDPTTPVCDIFRNPASDPALAAPVSPPDVKHELISNATGASFTMPNRDGDLAVIWSHVKNDKNCNFYDGLLIFRPGVYTDVDTLNNIGTKCKGMYWFMPDYDSGSGLPTSSRGIYYFDFPEASISNGVWDTPPLGFSQIIAGSPTSDWHAPPAFFDNTDHPSATGFWSLYKGWSPATTTNFQQTRKLMRYNGVSQTGWRDPAITEDKVNKTTNDENAGLNIDVPDDGAYAGGKATMTDVQTKPGTSANGTLTFSNSDLQPKVPTDAGQVENVDVRMSYLTDPSVDSAGKTIYGVYKNAQAPFATFNIQGGDGDCEIPLPLHPNDAAHPSTSYHWATEPAQSASDRSSVWDSVEAGQGDLMALCHHQGNPSDLSKPAWTHNNHWTPTLINNLTINFTISSRKDLQPRQTLGWFDGIEVRVDYKGRPSPMYPQGCDPSSAGVQWIFGGWSRIDWSQEDDYAEMCSGPPVDGDPDPFGVVFYGLHDNTYLGPTLNSQVANDMQTRDTTSDVWANKLSLGTVKISANNKWDWLDGTTVTSNASPPANATELLRKADGKGLRVKVADGQKVTVPIILPNDFVPDGAVVDTMLIRVRGAERGTDNSGLPLWSDVSLTATPTRNSGGNQWSSDTLPDCSPPPPRGTSYTTTLHDLRPLTMAPDNAPFWTASSVAPGSIPQWSIGKYYSDNNNAVNGGATPTCTAAFDSADIATNMSSSGMTPSNIRQPGWKVNDDWPWERTLIDNLRMPDGTAPSLNGLTLTMEWTAKGSDRNFGDRMLFLDSIEVEVRYRNGTRSGDASHVGAALETTLHPLRGCSTLRPGVNPESAGATGVDWDWGARISQPYPQSDDAYVSKSGTDDVRACPLIKVDQPMKLHIEGSIYAPTAAVDIRGNDNDAAFATGGVVARQLTTYRWSHGGGGATFGTGGILAPGGTGRVVTLYVCKGTAQCDDASSDLVAKADYTIDDSGGVGSGVTRTEYWRRPSENS